MNDTVELSLTQDQALVLFEVFARFEESDCLRLLNNAESLALSAIAAQIEKSLVQPFDPQYGELLKQAQARLAAGYEGLAPGVER